MIGGRIRFGIALIVTTLATVIFGGGFLVARLLGAGEHMFTWWARAWARVGVLSAGIRIQVEDRRDSDFCGPCVYVANHQSALDVPAVLLAIPDSFGFVAKRDLSRQPIIGAVLRASPSVFVDSSRPRESVESIHSAARQIAEGRSVLVFPEGERTWGTDLARFRKSAFVLAARAGVPIVPVTLYNAHDLLDERKKIVFPGTMRVTIDGPIDLGDGSVVSVRQAVDRAKSIIEANLASDRPRRALTNK